MKQEVTLQQLAELPEEKLNNLATWVDAHNYSNLTIGVLIHFLREKYNIQLTHKEVGSKRKSIKIYKGEEIVDTLWQAMKNEL